MKQKRAASPFARGLRDGVPIGLGYFAVAFSLGIMVHNAGMSPFQGFTASLLCLASAGEYAGFTVIAAAGAYWEIALVTLVTNARYILMSAALSQKLPPDTGLAHRLLMSYSVTDEIFGADVAYEGAVPPVYHYGATLVAAPLWALGTLLGAVVGDVLPAAAVSALSVALYGMFLAVIVPKAKQDRVVLCLALISFALSYLCSVVPGVREISSGTRIILLTVLISAAAALLFPRERATEADDHA